jgi:geranylgeranyl diphosphate synthase type II
MLILKKYKTLFEDYLHQNPFHRNVPSELYDPVQYIMHLGGKRLRPAMAMMGYELFREDLEKALPVAMAVEVFHNFSLVHDDIMDEAAVRRGKPTVHKQFGDNAAILSGDVMLVLAGQMITDLEETALIAPLMRIFNRAAIEVCEGQQMDMNFETRQDVSIPEYIKMIGLKTAALLAASLEMGTVTAGASKEDVQNVYDFGYQIGIAFQLQDDILDTFGDPEVFGKKIGGDIVQNKKTFLILKAMEVAGEEQKERLEELMNTSTQNEKEKIEEVTALLKSLNIPALAEAEKNKYKKLAFDSLDKVNGSDSGKVVLKELAELIVGREI